MARRHGATDEEIEGLRRLESSPLPESEREALRFAEKMTRDLGALGAEDMVRMRQHFEPAQVVEIACVVGMFNYLNRFAEAMGLWPTRPGEGGPGEPSG